MPSPQIALFYDDSAYLETVQRVRAVGGDGPMGLMGRQVAGREFLDAYLTHANYQEILGVLRNEASARSLAAYCLDHPRARHQLPITILVDQFLPRSTGNASAPILYTPCPPEAGFTWMRSERGPDTFALSGITHTLCTAGAVRLLTDLLTAPFEVYDSLICTSSAVVRMVRAVTGAYAEYLGDRFGSVPKLRLGSNKSHWA